ncbi:DUF1257 domain-containing protein [Anthocerotibacter panamensis]|uniref:DUF1257 domain-containing protein n=1 Tax=Anthocerotibacter panamensis TaxID=2857077 RepID=UPI001C406472|nr:DUF1257 domain-containing protein [Anthocerotibacter panamensis]
MSHFTQLKTQLRDLDNLTRALDDLKLSYEQGSVTVRGYQGQTRAAQVVLRQENHHDVGFAWNGHAFELVADLQYWKQPWTVERFLEKVNQRYAYNTVIHACAEQGFQVTTEDVNTDGTVRLVLQRWSA